MSSTPVSDRFGAALAALAARSERSDREAVASLARLRAAAADYAAAIDVLAAAAAD